MRPSAAVCVAVGNEKSDLTLKVGSFGELFLPLSFKTLDIRDRLAISSSDGQKKCLRGRRSLHDSISVVKKAQACQAGSGCKSEQERPQPDGTRKVGRGAR